MKRRELDTDKTTVEGEIVLMGRASVWSWWERITTNVNAKRTQVIAAASHEQRCWSRKWEYAGLWENNEDVGRGKGSARFWVRSRKTWADAAAAAERMTVTRPAESPSHLSDCETMAAIHGPLSLSSSRLCRPVRTRSFRIVIVALPFMVPQLPADTDCGFVLFFFLFYLFHLPRPRRYF